MINWYAISTKHNLELLAVENIERQGFNTYLPKVLKRPNKNKVNFKDKDFSKFNFNAYIENYKEYLNLIEYDDLIKIINDYE